MVVSSKDYEKLWFMYQSEGLPLNIDTKQAWSAHLARQSLIVSRFATISNIDSQESRTK